MVYNNEVVGKGRNEVNQTKNVCELKSKLQKYDSDGRRGMDFSWLVARWICVALGDHKWKDSFLKPFKMSFFFSDYKK